MLILYEHPLSPYAQKVKIVLREKNLPVETRMPENIGSGVAGMIDRLNPRAEVPVLIDGDCTVFDSTIILEYIEDKFPSPPMLPETPADRARARMIEEVCDTHYEAINWGLGEVRFFGRGGETLGPRLREQAIQQTAQIHAWLDAALGNRDWLVGNRFGWADLAAVPFVAMSAMFGAPPPVGSSLARWQERVCARPAVAQTVAEAMATIPAMESVASLVAAGGFKREFRDHRLEWLVRSGGIQVVLDGLANDNIRFTDTERFLGHRLSSPDKGSDQCK